MAVGHQDFPVAPGTAKVGVDVVNLGEVGTTEVEVPFGKILDGRPDGTRGLAVEAGGAARVTDRLTMLALQATLFPATAAGYTNGDVLAPWVLIPDVPTGTWRPTDIAVLSFASVPGPPRAVPFAYAVPPGAGSPAGLEDEGDPLVIAFDGSKGNPTVIGPGPIEWFGALGVNTAAMPGSFALNAPSVGIVAAGAGAAVDLWVTAVAVEDYADDLSDGPLILALSLALRAIGADLTGRGNS